MLSSHQKSKQAHFYGTLAVLLSESLILNVLHEVCGVHEAHL